MRNYFYLFFAILLINNIHKCDDSSSDDENVMITRSPRAWCWTKPVADGDARDITAEYGGINWGYCAVDESEGNKAQVIYKVNIETSQISGSGMIGVMNIIIDGTKGKGDQTVLWNDGMKEGEIKDVNLKIYDIGEPVRIRLISSVKDMYQCTKVLVTLGPKTYPFSCGFSFGCPLNCEQILEIDGNQDYTITVSTGNQKSDETDQPVYVQLVGTKGETIKQLLSDTGFKKGTKVDIKLTSLDVQEVYGVKLFMQEGSYHPEHISVIRDGDEPKDFNPLGQFISCPGKCELDLFNEKPIVSDDKKTADTASLTLKHITTIELPPKIIGKKIPHADIKDLQHNRDIQMSQKHDLTCEETVFNNDKFPLQYTDQPDWQLVIGVCPHNCMKNDAIVFGGQGLHPEESSICKAAIVDRAMPWTGGIIGIGIVKGQKQYDLPEEGDFNVINGIKVQNHKISKKSFFLFKVENIDMVEKDFRLVDNKGHLTHNGRLEFRLDGVWGSVATQGMTSETAKVVCLNMGYVDGIVRTLPISADALPDENQSAAPTPKASCLEYKGENYCGPDLSPVLFTNLHCYGNEQRIQDCQRDLADLDNHEDDAIIECGNIDFDQQDQIPEGTVRLVDMNGVQPKDGKGRIELFKRQWGTVCNADFDDNAAMVVCKQMGYKDGGFIVGAPQENDKCSNIDGNNYCGNEKITITEIQCDGTEKEVLDCGYNPDTKDCGHNLDQVVECQPSDDPKADPSGNSQIQASKPPIMPPDLGILKPMSIAKVNCLTRADDDIFRGDIGSVFLVDCPDFCAGHEGTIWGSGQYTLDSVICKAAIHAGVMQDSGLERVIEIIKTPEVNIFEGSFNRNIQSTLLVQKRASFVVSSPVFQHIQLAKKFEIALNEKTGGGGTIVSNPNGKLANKGVDAGLISKSHFVDDGWDDEGLSTTHQTHMGFLQMNYQLRKQFKNHLRLHNSNKTKSSFLQIDPSVEDTVNVWLVFKFICPIDFIFDGIRTFVETKDMPGQNLIIKAIDDQKITIMLKAEMQEGGKLQTLMGYSSCNCFGLKIDEQDEVIFEQRCTNKAFKTGYRMPLDQEVHLALTYNGNYGGKVVNNKFYVNGEQYSEFLHNWEWTCLGTLDIGSYSAKATELFKGRIQYLQIYREDLTQLQIQRLIKNDPGKLGPTSVKQLQPKTTDDRICVSLCTKNQIPGQPGAQDPPKESELGKSELKESDEIIEEQEANLTPGIKINCLVKGSDQIFEGETGKTFRVTCEKDCSTFPGAICYGTQIYADESTVCQAALHSGYHTKAGGTFLMSIGTGQNRYDASEQNDILSVGYSASDRSITFKKAKPLIKMDCETTGLNEAFQGQVGEQYSIECPKACSKTVHEVYGDVNYSADSKICQAAIHAGVITDRGGSVSFILSEGLDSYDGITQNMINSKKKDAYVMSYRFLGSSLLACDDFYEDYSVESIWENWKLLNQNDEFPGKWSFIQSPTKVGLTQQGIVIKQTSEDIDRFKFSEFNYATKLISKKYSCNDGMFKANVFFEKLKEAYLMFRYFDDNNFYSIEVNKKEDDGDDSLDEKEEDPNGKESEGEEDMQENNIRFVKKVYGNPEVIQSTFVEWQINTWYRFSIVYMGSSIQVYLQIGDYQDDVLLFDIVDEDLQAGTIAFGVDDTNSVLFDGLKVTGYDPLRGIHDEKRPKYIYDYCVRKNTHSLRHRYCQQKFGNYKVGVFHCENPHTYCQECCDDIVPATENIAHYHCYTKCYKVQEERPDKIKEDM